MTAARLRAGWTRQVGTRSAHPSVAHRRRNTNPQAPAPVPDHSFSAHHSRWCACLVNKPSETAGRSSRDHRGSETHGGRVTREIESQT